MKNQIRTVAHKPRSVARFAAALAATLLLTQGGEIAAAPSAPPGYGIRVLASGGPFAGQILDGIVTDLVSGNIFVATVPVSPGVYSTQFTLYRITPAGSVTTIGTYPYGHTELVRMAMGPDGRIYTLDSNTGTVRTIDPNTGATSLFTGGACGGCRHGLNFDASGNLILGYESISSFWKVTPGGLIPLGNITASVPNGNHGDSFSIQPNGDYFVPVDCGGSNNYSIAAAGHVDGTPYSSLRWTSPTNAFSLYGPSCGNSTSAVHPVTGDAYSTIANFGNGNSRILVTPAAGGSSTVFLSGAGDGDQRGIVDMAFGKITTPSCGSNTHSLFFVDRLANAVYEVYKIVSCNQAPIASCKDTTLMTVGTCTATVTAADINNGSTDPDVPPDALAFSVGNAGPLGPGIHTVSLFVTDARGASASCQSVATVKDASAPVLSCPVDITVTAALLANSAIVDYTVGVAENCSVVAQSIVPASGSAFAIGATLVNASARDAAGNTGSCSFSVNVLPHPNQAPVANSDAYNTNEDSALAAGAPGVLGNDHDIEGSPLTAVLVSGPTHAAAFVLNADGSFEYTPAANFFGADSFEYRARDGNLESAPALVTITVNAVSDAPVAANDFYATFEDQPLLVPGLGVLGNDNDPDSPVLTATLLSGPTHGILGLNPDGSFLYTPAPNFNGTDSFTYKARDGILESNPAMVTIAIASVEDDTLAVNDEYAIEEDGALSVAADVGVLANDTDPDAEVSLAVELVLGPSYAASFVLRADGSFDYTPTSNFAGVDTFSYRVVDDGRASNVAMVTIQVAAVNDPPSFDALADQTIDEDSGAHSISVTGIVPGPANEALQSVTLTANSSNPALVSVPSITGTGATRTLTFAPGPQLSGDAMITVVADDGQTTANTFTRRFKVTVVAVNDPPAFDPIPDQSIDEDAGVRSLAVTGVSAGPADESSQTVSLSATSSDTSIVPHPVVSGSGATRMLSYAPLPNANGEVTVTVTADDGQAANAKLTRTFRISVAPQNDAPSFDAIADQSVDEDAGAQNVLVTGVLAGPANEAAQTVTFAAVSSDPAIVPNPAVTGVGATRTLSYAPAANANGEVTITITAHDGQALNHSATRSFRIRVNAVNDRPTASNQSVSTDEDAATTFTLSAADVDNSGLNFSVGLAGNGTVSVGATSCVAAGAGSTCTASVTYTPAANYNGADSFNFAASDGSLASAPALVSINVRPVNDAPGANNDSYVTNEDTVLNAPSVLGNDTDPDVGDTRTAVLVTGTTNGALQLNGDGTFRYTPNAHFNGADAFTYKVRDGAGAESNVASVAITVAAVNDAPAGLSFTVTPGAIEENGTVALSGSFADPDLGDAHTVTISWGDGAQSTVNLAAGAFNFSASHQYLDDNAADAFTISVNVADAAGASSGPAGVTFAVLNLAPTIAAITGPTAPLAVGSSATIVATYADLGSRDTHTCMFRWDDGTADTVVNGVAGRCSASHTYAKSNVYDVQVTITDDDGGVATDAFRYVVVYDANAGFVTGGGWIMSPAGAYVPNVNVAGRATFGFVSKYKPGSSVPTGNTEFQFKAADLNFKSVVYEWMVISGAKVRYRGTGTINGAGSFGFELTAWDGDVPGGGGADRFRLKIWDQNRGNAMLYDNQMGAGDDADPTTALGGGSIVIHK